ncbi:MAG: leucine-rich repeat protein [Lachnospiraceae bacterium]|nr:leucine-rich repeat protein [Lachnospiraceae bacterium]
MFSSIYVKADVLEPELIYNEYAEYATPEFLHNYTIHASGLKMNLAQTANGYVRVEHMENQMLIEEYNTNFKVISKRYIADELPLFGGFYAGTENYYLVYGQENPAEDDTKEVIRVVKYDLNWNRISHASLYGERIYMPFDGGGLRMTEYNGYLYIRTCYEAYALPDDGLHHQSNLSLQIRTSDMSFVPYKHTLQFTDGSSYTCQYSDWDTGHSFNQFILIDDAKNIVTLDHGDGNPRDAVLRVFDEKAGTDTFAVKGFENSAASMLKFGGFDGQNLTRASIGGLAYSSDTYLAVGTSIDQESIDWNNTENRNAFVSVIPRSNLNTPATIHWLTSYPEDGNYGASNPYILKMENDKFLVMWEEIAGYSEYRSLYQTGNLSYVFLDKAGIPISSVKTVKSWLSDCTPVVINGKATWYECNREGMRFRQIDVQGNFNTIPVLTLEGDITVEASVGFDGSVGVSWNKISGADGYYILRRIVKSDSYSVKKITITNPKQTSYNDRISYYTVGDVCEYVVYAYNDKVWSKASNAEYVTLTGLDMDYFYPAEEPLKNGKKYTVGDFVYKHKNGKMTLVGKSKNFQGNVVKIPSKVTVNGKKYPVTAIAAKVFANNDWITQVVIGKNVESIGKNAFSNCDYLWKITINSSKLKASKVGKNVFKKPGGSFAKKVYVKLPKKKYKAYKKILKARGIQKKGVKVSFSGK